MKLGLCPNEKGSGETGYRIVVIYSTATMPIITSMSSPIHKQNSGSFCRNVEIVIFCQSLTFTHGPQTLFARTKSQFQNQKGKWVWATERYTILDIGLKVRKPSKVKTPNDYTKQVNDYNTKHENDMNMITNSKQCMGKTFKSHFIEVTHTLGSHVTLGQMGSSM